MFIRAKLYQVNRTNHIDRSRVRPLNRWGYSTGQMHSTPDHIRLHSSGWMPMRPFIGVVIRPLALAFNRCSWPLSSIRLNAHATAHATVHWNADATAQMLIAHEPLAHETGQLPAVQLDTINSSNQLINQSLNQSIAKSNIDVAFNRKGQCNRHISWVFLYGHLHVYLNKIKKTFKKEGPLLRENTECKT